MEGQKVHEYTVEMGTNGLPVARLGVVHNLITFISSGAPKLHYFDGRWVDDGGNAVPDENVPEEAKRQVATIPFDGSTDRTPDVMHDCEFCKWSGGLRQYARHLADSHIRPGQVADPASLGEEAVPQPAKLRPEDLPDGNYVTDDDGYVVLNVDGSPRKKGGRPRNPVQE